MIFLPQQLQMDADLSDCVCVCVFVRVCARERDVSHKAFLSISEKVKPRPSHCSLQGGALFAALMP